MNPWVTVGTPSVLKVGSTGNGSQQTVLEQPETTGVELSLEGQSPRRVQCAFSPLPMNLPPRFTLVAEFFLPADFDLTPDGQAGRWAAMVGIRSSDDFDSSDWKAVGATHQVRYQIGATEATIGLGIGASVTAMPDITVVPESEAYKSSAWRPFTLQADISLSDKRGTSRLRTPDKSWPERTWTFDFDPTGVGFGLAMAEGAGMARATATSFRIYDASIRNFIWAFDPLLTLAFTPGKN